MATIQGPVTIPFTAELTPYSIVQINGGEEVVVTGMGRDPTTGNGFFTTTPVAKVMEAFEHARETGTEVPLAFLKVQDEVCYDYYRTRLSDDKVCVYIEQGVDNARDIPVAEIKHVGSLIERLLPEPGSLFTEVDGQGHTVTRDILPGQTFKVGNRPLVAEDVQGFATAEGLLTGKIHFSSRATILNPVGVTRFQDASGHFVESGSSRYAVTNGFLSFHNGVNSGPIREVKPAILTVTPEQAILAERAYTHKRWGTRFDDANRPQDWHMYLLNELSFHRGGAGQEVALMPERTHDLPFVMALQRTAATIISDIESGDRKRGDELPTRPDDPTQHSEQVLKAARGTSLPEDGLPYMNRPDTAFETDINSWGSEIASLVEKAYGRPSTFGKTYDQARRTKLEVVHSIMHVLEEAERHTPGILAEAAAVSLKRARDAQQNADVKASLELRAA